MGLFSRMISFIQTYIPCSPMGIFNSAPQHTIKTEQYIKAVILSYNRQTKKKQQQVGRNRGNRIPTTPTKPANMLPNRIQGHETAIPSKLSAPRLGSPRTKVQKQKQRSNTLRSSVMRLHKLGKKTVRSPCLLPLEMDIDEDGSNYDFDTPMENAPPLALPSARFVSALPMTGDGNCDVEMHDVDAWDAQEQAEERREVADSQDDRGLPTGQKENDAGGITNVAGSGADCGSSGKTKGGSESDGLPHKEGEIQISKELMEGIKRAKERLRNKQAKVARRKEASKRRGAERDVTFDVPSSSEAEEDD
ncbi:hypothetical protein EV426DRAFT_706545 [Tirmania nivea]|nr:hypothetical protein EV426DRAFT_706545 [Tirmania nivea]